MEWNTTISPDELKVLEGIVSTEQLKLIESILESWICSILSYLGIIANIINITIFCKMGFKETANISMTSIAIWDVIKCFCIAVSSLTFPIKMASLEFGMSWQGVTTVVFRYIKSMSGSASGAIAAYVSFERCICVSMPFMVKTLLPRRVVASVCVTISIFVVASIVIVYAIFDFVQITDEKTNLTYITFVRSDFHYQHPIVSVYVFTLNVVYPIVTFCITCVCTAIIIHYLRKWSSVRNTMRGDPTNSNALLANTSHQLSPRDRQVIKMLVVIIVVYIICFIPRIAFFLTLMTYPGFEIGKRYNNLFWVCLYMVAIFDVVNGSTNIFIFYSMSSQFKATLHQLFHINTYVKKKNTFHKNNQLIKSTSASNNDAIDNTKATA